MSELLEEPTSLNTTENILKFQLGDIIQIRAPKDQSIDNHIFFIKYVDFKKVVIVDENGNAYEIALNETTGEIMNTAIREVDILSRSLESGYAKQNNLQIGVWVDIYFNWDIPMVLTGKITNLEEDMIEITSYPANTIIYIDFAYQGIPEEMLIEKIIIRPVPADLSVQEESSVAAAIEEESSTIALEEEPVAALVEPITPTETELEEPKEFVFDASQFNFGESLDEVSQIVDVPENEQRFGIDQQTSDLLDDLISDIPNIKRNDTTMNNIHKLIERFKQLRNDYSLFDKQGNAQLPKPLDDSYKPLVDILQEFKQKLYWIMPVAKIVKKIYNDEEDNGGEEGEEEEEILNETNNDTFTIIASLTNEMNRIEEAVNIYKEGEIIEEENNYKTLNTTIDPFLTPFEVNKSNKICSNEITTSLTAIVNNVGVLETKVIANKSKEGDKRDKPVLTRKKFYTQEYNTGSTYLEINKVKGGEDIIKRKALTKNDIITFDSLLMLPVETVCFASVNLPNTDVMQRSMQNRNFLNYSQFLNNKTHLASSMIDDIEREQDYNDTFLLNTNHFEYINKELDELGLTNKQEYNKFLQTVLPNTNFLIKFLVPLLDGNKLSTYNYLSYLEPFMVYNKDLHISHYKKIDKLISEKIVEYKKNYIFVRKFYVNEKTSKLLANYRNPSCLIILNHIFEKNDTILEKTMRLYGFADKKEYEMFTYSELLVKLNAIDNMVLYNNAIALLGVPLMIDDTLVEQQLLQMNAYINNVKNNTEAPISALAGSTSALAGPTSALAGPTSALAGPTPTTEQCQRLNVIAKRYLALDELEDDNNTEIYFDKQYDTTFYDIIKDIKVNPAAPLSEKIVVIKEMMMKEHKMNEQNALRDAKAMAIGKRVIEEGDLAILENTDENEIVYYRRMNNAWVQDTMIDSTIFTDNAKVLCNLNEKCINVNNTCKELEAGGNEIKVNNLKRIMAEFDIRLQQNKEMTKQKIETELNNAVLRIKTLNEINNAAKFRYDLQKQNIGNTASEYTVVQSPYAGLRDLILGLEDYAKKQMYIDKFVTYFTRQPTKNENQFWLYCLETDVKLIPRFLVQMADAYIKKSGYEALVYKICKEQGKLSDDGDAWVDKESGYMIRMIAFSAEEEYSEEGFKLITSAVLESDAGEKILENVPQEKERKFESREAQNVFEIVRTLTTFMNITLKPRIGFIIRNVLKKIGELMPAEKDYNKMVAEIAKTGAKKPDTYETAYNKSLVIITLCYFLIAIQTSIPSIKTSKTFPGCKKAFNGFPMRIQGGDDRTAIQYIACIVGKIEKRSIKVWSAVAAMKEKDILKKMESFLTEHIINTEDVELVKKEKEDYLLNYKEEDDETVIPFEHNIKRWVSFLPLLYSTKLQANQLTDVSADFKEKFLQMIKTGKTEQHEMMAVLQSKIIYLSLGIQERIQKIVEKKMTILKNATGNPLIENACCNDSSETTNPLKYFIKEQSEIGTLNETIKRISDLLYDVKSMSKASILYDPSSKTLRKLVTPATNFSEETIYRAVIFFCKYNSSKPVRSELKTICMEKPANFNMNESIEKQIKNLKNNGHNYNNDYLQQLLAIINTNNRIELNIHHSAHNEIQINRINTLKVLLAPENAVEEERKIMKEFRAQFLGFLNKFAENGTYTGDAGDIRAFKNYLAIQNDIMKTRIFAFVKENSKEIGLKKNEMKDLEECLDRILVFQQISGEKHRAKDEQEGINTYDRMCNFIKNSVRRLTREFPEMLINNVNNKNSAIPKHWNLSKFHIKDLKDMINKHYTVLNKFLEKPVTKAIMKKSIVLTRDIEKMAENTEINTYTIQQMKLGQVDKYDIQLSKFLLKFYLYVILDNFVSIKQSDIAFIRKKELERSEISLKMRVSGEEEEEDEVEEEDRLKELNEEISAGNQEKLEENLADIIVAFSKMICKDKELIDKNYTTLMEKVLRAKDKEKDDMTQAFKEMDDNEKNIENIFKDMRLERWSKGLQKGLFVYNKATYEEESLMMEKQKLLDIKRGKKMTDVIDMVDDDILANENEEDRIANEEMYIHYQGEAENEEYDDLDGDEYVP